MASYYPRSNVVDIRKQDKVFEGNVADYDATFTLVKKILKFPGHRVTINDSKFASICWNIYFWFVFMNVVVSSSLEIVNAFQTAAEGTFLDLFTMLPCAGYLLVALAKASKIKIYRSVFENLISELREMWPTERVGQEEHGIMNEALSRIRLLIKGYFTFNMMLGSIFILPTLITYIKRFMGSEEPLLLPFYYWLPFDPYNGKKFVFEAVLFAQFFHCFYAVTYQTSADLLFCIFLSHITTQFSLLAVRIKKLVYVPIDDQLIEAYPLGGYSKMHDDENGQKISEGEDRGKEAEQELGLIIQRHKALFRLSRDIENMYTFSLLINFMNSSIMICFCLFCVAFVEKWNEFIYKLFFITATSQIWILCWYGQRLIDTSTGVAEALYDSGWYDAPQKLRKSILIMIVRSQIKVHITTYGFSVISLESYATILKTSWSYFTLLINMYKE